MNIFQISLLKNSGCSGGCKFCSLSVESTFDRTKTINESELQDSFMYARNNNARLELVFPSVGADQNEVFSILGAMQKIIEENQDVELAINPGICTRPEFYTKLKSFGVTRYRNNMETSHRLFQQLVSERPNAQQAKLTSLSMARKAGLKIDTGWLCGLGENNEDCFDILHALQLISPDSITLNYFDPNESAEAFEHTQPSNTAALGYIDMVRAQFPATELSLGGAYLLWLNDYTQVASSGVYIGTFLDHGLSKKAMKADSGRIPVTILEL